MFNAIFFGFVAGIIFMIIGNLISNLFDKKKNDHDDEKGV